MEKILPEQPKPQNPGVIIHNLMEQVVYLRNLVTQQQNISIILAMELFRTAKVVEENVLVAPGYSALNITGPLAWMIPQKRIDAIEHIFGDDPPTLQFSQEIVNDLPALVARLIPLSEAEAEAARALN